MERPLDLRYVYQTLANLVYEFNQGGGNLHIAIDDGNLSDGDLSFCALKVYEETDRAKQFAEFALLNFLQRLSYEQRVEVTCGHN